MAGYDARSDGAAGWLVARRASPASLGQDEFPGAGEPEPILVVAVLDDDLAVAGHELLAGDAALATARGRRGPRQHGGNRGHRPIGRPAASARLLKNIEELGLWSKTYLRMG